MHKIIVVDDDVDIIDIVKIVLESKNYLVRCVLRWQQLFDVIENFQPDLIILDITLSGADGREICKQLKSNSLTADIPVLLFSAILNSEKAYIDCNADGFIAKPFDLANFIGRVQTILKEKGKSLLFSTV